MVKKEEIVALATKLMNSRETIRNIGIVAHIDHGKCISPSDRLTLYNGTTIKAEELFEKSREIGVKACEDAEKIVYELPNKFYAFSLNKGTGKIEKKPITHAWKLKNSKEMKKITLRNGLGTTTTPEHKYLVLENLKFVEKEAKDLQKGDRIVCARELDISEEIDLKKELLEKIAEKPFYAYLKPELYEAIKVKIREKGSKIAGSTQKRKTVLFGLYNKKRVLVRELLEIAQKTELGTTKVYDGIEKIRFKCGETMKLPQEFEELFYLAGLFIGDGTGKKFVVGKKELAQECQRICKELGIRTKVLNKKVPEIYTSNTLSELLNSLFDYPKRQKSRNVKISNILFRAPKSCSAAFLRAYFDCDGTVERARSAVSITSASPQMIKDLLLLLLRFGCVGIRNKDDDTIYISGESVKKFAKEVGFFLENKMKKALSLAEKTSGNIVCDTVPINNGLADFRNAQSTKVSMNAIGKHYYKYENKRYSPTIQTFNEITQQFATLGVAVAELEKVNTQQLAFIEVEEISSEFHETVYDFTVQDNHNFVANGVVIHNTTMTDNLVAAAGLISEELAGKQQFMDYYELEQKRGITINAANISLVHEIEGKDYLVNIIDTPGHIDFGGEVIRAMRAVDGVIVVVDAVEGVMPQTETVIRQALKENVKPVLFINKVDRLVNELQVTEGQMQERFQKTILQVNKLIQKNCPKEFGKKWLVNVKEGSVTFGSAYNNWALNIETIKKTGVSFKEVYSYCKEGKQKELAKKSPLHEAILGMIAKHMPSPIEAQKYRTPKIWSGKLDSEEGKAMLECLPKGPVCLMVNDVSVDPHAGDVATGRLYSGTVKKGVKVQLIGSQKEVQIQQVGVMMGPERVTVVEIPAGNIASIIGAKEIYAGETVSTKKIKEFESFMSTAEPVITISVEPKSAKDLPKLIETIRQICKEDPNIKASLNQETGEHLLSGMGELHLEVTQYRIETDHKIPIQVGQPIVVYRETITKQSPVIEGKTPNKHNKFKISVKPLEKEFLDKLVESKLQGKIRDKDKELREKLVEMGLDRNEARKAWYIHKGNILVDASRGVQALFEVKELIMQAFQDAMSEGPLAKEKCFGVKVQLHDAKLHEDAIHRGPAQVLPAVTRAIYACVLSSDALILEPKQILTINVPQDFMGAASRELGSRRTQITEMRTEGDTTIIIAKAPVKELIGFSASIRGATEGRAIWTAEYYGYEKLPKELQHDTIVEIRKRKGMDPEPKQASYFMD